MEKLLYRMFIVVLISVALAIWICYSAQTFVHEASILHSVTYHGKFAQWMEPPDHWQLSVGQFFLLFLLPWIGICLFNNWKTGKMFDFQ
jgi:hypothetical protein